VSRHWPIINWRGEVVAAACNLRASVTPDLLPMAEVPEEVTCRKCRNSERLLSVLRDREEREAAQLEERRRRALAVLVERHREEYEELLTAEAIIDVLGG
jgi:hypothetical protein